MDFDILDLPNDDILLWLVKKDGVYMSNILLKDNKIYFDISMDDNQIFFKLEYNVRWILTLYNEDIENIYDKDIQEIVDKLVIDINNEINDEDSIIKIFDIIEDKIEEI
jgi:hypothetical protein